MNRGTFGDRDFSEHNQPHQCPPVAAATALLRSVPDVTAVLWLSDKTSLLVSAYEYIRTWKSSLPSPHSVSESRLSQKRSRRHADIETDGRTDREITERALR